MKLIKYTIKKDPNTKEISIKILWTKFDIKITWNQMLSNETKNKVQLEKKKYKQKK